MIDQKSTFLEAVFSSFVFITALTVDFGLHSSFTRPYWSWNLDLPAYDTIHSCCAQEKGNYYRQNFQQSL